MMSNAAAILNAVLEADDPKQAVRRLAQRHGIWHPTGYCHDGDFEDWYFTNGPYRLDLEKETIGLHSCWRMKLIRLDVGNQVLHDWIRDSTGDLIGHLSYEEVLPRALSWATRNMHKVPVTEIEPEVEPDLEEAEDPKRFLRFIDRAPNPQEGKMVSGRSLRRLCGRYWAKNVYVWKAPAIHLAGWASAILQVDLNNYGLIRQEWACGSNLMDVLQRWTNLKGVPLWINGRKVGVVGDPVDL